MSITSLFFLMFTFYAWQAAHRHPEEVGRVLASIFSVVCFVIGVSTASIFLKGLILLAVVMYPAIPRRRKSL